MLIIMGAVIAGNTGVVYSATPGVVAAPFIAQAAVSEPLKVRSLFSDFFSSPQARTSLAHFSFYVIDSLW